MRRLLLIAVAVLFAWTAIGHDLALAQTSIWRLSLIGPLMVGTYLIGRWWMRRNREQWKLEHDHSTLAWREVS